MSNFDPKWSSKLLPIGTKVRFKLGKNERKHFRELWSDQVYEIIKIVKPQNGQSFWRPYYYLGGVMRNNGQFKRFYKEDLQVVENTTTNVKEVKRFAISAIYNPRRDEDGVVWYLVAWKNFTKRDQRTYIRRSRLQIDAPKLLQAFEKRNNVRFIYNGKGSDAVREIKFDKNNETMSKFKPTVQESIYESQS